MAGLADALMMVGLRYGSHAGGGTGRGVGPPDQPGRLQHVRPPRAGEGRVSTLFDREAYLAGETIRELDEDVRARNRRSTASVTPC